MGSRLNTTLLIGRKSPLTKVVVTPNEGLGLKLEGRDYRTLMKWWLGKPLVTPDRRLCPCCQGQMDMFGDHLVSCKLNQPQKRHNLLRDALADCLRQHKISVQKEVAIGGHATACGLGPAIIRQ